MNKKGFTTVELIVSFMMVIVILTTLIGFTTAYRGKVNNEQVRSSLIDFKNTIIKTVNDDITNYSLVGMVACVGEDNCVNLVDREGNAHVLKIVNMETGVYLNYDGTNYMLPDSDLNKNYKDEDNVLTVSEAACDFTKFEFSNYENRIYSVNISFKHYLINEEFNINLTIT